MCDYLVVPAACKEKAKMIKVHIPKQQLEIIIFPDWLPYSIFKCFLKVAFIVIFILFSHFTPQTQISKEGKWLENDLVTSGQ
jgi:hypothetical protein